MIDLLACPPSPNQVTSEAYSSPSIVLAANQHDGSRIIFDDFREAYYWLRQNTPEDAKVMSWWDYGYQITACLLYTSPSPRDATLSRMPSSA